VVDDNISDIKRLLGKEDFYVQITGYQETREKEAAEDYEREETGKA
jgi:hypothetical protein